jgi:hypothetical protein
VVKYGTARQATDDNIEGNMRTACWVTKATDTHTHTLRICNTYCFSMVKFSREGPSVLPYMYIARLVVLMTSL